MKKILITLAALSLAAVVQAGAPKQLNEPMVNAVGQWYVAAYGGMNVWQTGIPAWGTSNRHGTKNKIGWDAGLKVGYDFNPAAWVRPVLEVEVFYNAFNKDFPEKNQSGWEYEKFNTWSLAAMGNALAKFDCGAWQPYVGAGLGVHHFQGKIEYNNGWSSWKVKSTGLAWQLMAGTDYKLDTNWALFLEYKWLNYQMPGHKNKPTSGDNYTDARIGQQLVNLGVRYSF